MNKTDMVNLALIGVGAWGKNYILTCKNFNNIRIKYLCAASEDSLINYKKDYITTTNYQELFNYSDIDGVIIATPNVTHDKLTYEFLKRGFNVLVEKPLSEDYRKTLSLRSLQQKTKGNLQVGHVYLFDPAYLKTKALVQSTGKLRYLDYEGTSYGLLRKGSSVLWDIGPHAISLCLDISQQNPKIISAWANNILQPNSKFYDACSIKLEFENEIFAYIRLNWLFPEKRRKLIITGENSSILYDAEANKKVVFYENIIPKNQDIYLRYQYTNISYPTYNSITPLENEIKEFVKGIKKGKSISYSGLAFGIKVTQLLTLAEQSIAKNGKQVKVNITK